MANKILHTTIMQKNSSGGKNIIYPKTVTKNIIDGSSTLDQTLNVLKSPDMSAKITTFTQASTRENLVSGETLATSHGKIMKLISDLKSLAYVDTIGVSNLDSTLTTAYNERITTDKITSSTTITSEGYVADARAINNLQNQINTVNKNIVSNYFCFKYGTVIYANEDLNDIVKFGNYYCQVNVNAETLKNCPTTKAFIMKVYSGTGTSDDYVVQELTDHYANKYIRQGVINNINSTKTWTEWKRLITNSDLENQSSLLKGGTLLANGTDLNDIRTFGNYYVHLNVIAETLINSPTKYAFSLKVSSGVGDGDTSYIIQELMTYTGEKYIRKYNSFSDDPWISWKKYVLDGDLKRHFYDYESITSGKEYAIQDIFYKLPADASIHYVTVSCGNLFSLIIQKYYSHSYGSILRFGYGDRLVHYRIDGGGWYKASISYTETQIAKLV